MSRNRSLPAGATLTVKLLSAYLANSTVAAQDLPGLIKSTRKALMGDRAAAPTNDEAPTFTPAISVRKSLSSSAHILSMIDGKPYRTLRRHLAAHGLTPESYRARYQLPADYPMVAPDYAARRRALALQTGLGRGRHPDVSVSEGGAQVRERCAPASDDTSVPPSAEIAADAEAARSEPASTAMTGQDSGSLSDASNAAAAADVLAEASVTSTATTESQSEAVAQPQAIAGEPERAKPRSGGRAPEIDSSMSSRHETRRPRPTLGLFSTRRVDAEEEQALPPEVVPANSAPAAAPPTQSAQADPTAEVLSARLVLMEAIARRRAVAATYNGAAIKLSPHQLFERNGDLFTTAVNASKKWRLDEEKRLGQFKLAGLKDVKLLDESITPLPSFSNALPRPEDTLVLAI